MNALLTRIFEGTHFKQESRKESKENALTCKILKDVKAKASHRLNDVKVSYETTVNARCKTELNENETSLLHLEAFIHLYFKPFPTL